MNILNISMRIFFKSSLGILRKLLLSLLRRFHKIQMTVTINYFRWVKRNERSKKIYTLKKTNFFQICNSQVLVVCTVHHLLFFFAAPLIFNWLSYRSCSHLVLRCADITISFSSSSYSPILTLEHKILWIFKCIQELQSLEAMVHRCSLKRLFWKSSGKSKGKHLW